jgi:uncharacterized protein
MIDAAYFNPAAYGDLAGANFAVWLVSHVLGDMKFMAIFSMLFGAGMVLMAERIEARGHRAARLHYRRMLWLILFGLLHAHLLWYGDILYTYGMCGLLVFLFRRLRPPWLLILGILALAVASAIFVLFGWSMQFWPPEAMEDFSRDWAPPPEEVDRELAIYRGGWLEQMPHRAQEAVGIQTMIFLIFLSWRAGGLMLIGMGLYKLGVFAARKSAAFYATLVAAGVLAGIPIILLGVRRNLAAEWDPSYSFFLGIQFNYWGSLLVALGWVGLVMLICRAPAAAPWTRPLAATGRMALTNYLLQSVLCTLLFYGHGLGLYGRVERVGQAGIVVAVWIVQLILSPLWLRRFRFGPMEWLWRTLTYLKPQPMRRVA